MAADPTIVLNGQVRRQLAHRWVESAVAGTVLTFGKPKRTLPQNARLHAHLTDIARQAEWPPKSGQRRTVEAWKDIMTAALRSANNELDVVPGLNGGFVLLGMHTSNMTIAEMGELITLIEAFAAQNGIELSDHSSEGPDRANNPAGAAA
jgi:hypothetical protein